MYAINAIAFIDHRSAIVNTVLFVDVEIGERRLSLIALFIVLRDYISYSRNDIRY